MTYELIRFMFFAVTITSLLGLSEKYIVRLIKYILLEGEENRERKKGNQNKNIKTAKFTFYFIGLAIMMSASIPINNYNGNISSGFWAILPIITALLILILALETIRFTSSDKFKLKFITIKEEMIIAESPQLMIAVEAQVINNEEAEVINIDELQINTASSSQIINTDKVYIKSPQETQEVNVDVLSVESENELENYTENVVGMMMRKDIEPIALTEKLIRKEKIGKDSKLNCESLLSNRNIDAPISWIDKTTVYTYITIFDFLNNVVEGGIFLISTEKELALISFICENFTCNDKKIANYNVKRTYDKWAKSQKKSTKSELNV